LIVPPCSDASRTPSLRYSAGSAKPPPVASHLETLDDALVDENERVIATLIRLIV